MWGFHVLVFFVASGVALLAAGAGVIWIETRLVGSFRRSRK